MSHGEVQTEVLFSTENLVDHCHTGHPIFNEISTLTTLRTDHDYMIVDHLNHMGFSIFDVLYFHID